MATVTARAYSPLALEDNFNDVINKACKGLAITPSVLAMRAGVAEDKVKSLRIGEFSAKDESALSAIAFVLGLNAQALLDVANGSYCPKPVSVMDGFAMHTTDFGGDMTVNAYVVWDPETKQAISFDTGTDSTPMQKTIAEHGLQLCHICITHTHMDHLADLDALQAACPHAHSHGPAIENPLGMNPLGHGDGLVLGSLNVRVLGTHGHTPGGLSYYITGLKTPLVVVGDALFAGSMGGAALAYQTAIANNRKWILSLPDNTIIAPGHGPLTTVGEERRHNPFFTEGN